MKKLLGSICSLAAGALTFLFLSLANLKSTATAGGEVVGTETVNAWDMIKDSADIKGYTLYKIATIGLIVVACVLILVGIVLLLQNLGTLKAKLNLNLVNNIVLCVFVVFAVLALVGLFIMGGEMSAELMGMKVSAGPAIGAWLNVIVGAVACALSWVFARE